MVVLKFGGTSVADRAAIGRLVDIVRSVNGQPVVVVSALGGATDRLLGLAAQAATGDSAAVRSALRQLLDRHVEVAHLVGDPAMRADVEAFLVRQFDDLSRVLEALSVLKDVSPRWLDAIAAVGELCSSRIVAAALSSNGLPASWVDARRVMVTTDAYTAAAPLMDETASAIASGGYLAHEGLLVISGRRGPRAAREQRRAAMLSLAAFGGLAAMGLVVAVTTLTREAWIATGVVGVLSLLGIATAFVGRQHSLPGELLAAAALPGWCAPVAIQGGIDVATAATLWAVWSIGFAAATCVVHVVIARSKQQPFGPALAGTFGFAIAGPVISVAAIPLTLTAISLVWLPVSARRLRHVGWSVIAASVLTLVVVLQVL